MLNIIGVFNSAIKALAPNFGQRIAVNSTATFKVLG
ncbi:MAG: hypothetical protein ACI8RE_000220 [Ilumatobacter sp.]|jgi:hypothetical protein|tara:strand:- start:2883 stop:2990 length:108 start_codon:yes stop_codon:yes gene_type:complete